MAERIFTAKGAWHGGYYELSMEIGPTADERLMAALTALWGHPDLQGCYLEREPEPAEQPRCPADSIEAGNHLFGIARLPNGSQVACGSCLVRVEESSDWLDFYLPLGSLGTAYPVCAFPFDATDPHTDWRNEVEDWLAGIGRWVGRSVPFRIGLIGFEASGHAHAADFAVTGIPAERHVGYLWPAGDPKTEPFQVEYYRRNTD